MAIPDYQSMMRPVLAVLADGEARRSALIRERLAADLELSRGDLAETIRSGTSLFTNRVAWALAYLYKTGLLDRPSRGTYRITSRGSQVLADNPVRVDLSVLREFPEFAAFVSGSRPERQDENERHRPTSSQIELSQTPDEAIINAYERLRASTAEELMDRVLAGSPYFFERLVLDVLTAMGYGGSRAEAAEHLGRSGDEGVDGVIHEDRLGLDVIYVQAKRWGRERTVGRPEVQAFVGALQGQRATKGVLITTAQFSAEALRYAQSISPRVVLVDGGELADLMIDYGVGVTVRDTFAVYRLDADYFHDEVEQLL